MITYLIGIDDTDNLESRGTGFLSRSMGEAITVSGLGITGGITRHQLLFDPRVPYTSHNSSACLEVTTSKPDELWEFMMDFLVKSNYGILWLIFFLNLVQLVPIADSA